ncbi:hypothetical protein DFH09DRAFT_1097130 [Mycena vulgaris]|nr:hypothetical protein DFH09DRAFT_1097130 [Mycena vulgaris]
MLGNGPLPGPVAALVPPFQDHRRGRNGCNGYVRPSSVPMHLTIRPLREYRTDFAASHPGTKSPYSPQRLSLEIATPDCVRPDASPYLGPRGRTQLKHPPIGLWKPQFQRSNQSPDIPRLCESARRGSVSEKKSSRQSVIRDPEIAGALRLPARAPIRAADIRCGWSCDDLSKQQTNGKCQVNFDKISSREGGESQAARLIGLIIGGSGGELSIPVTSETPTSEESQNWLLEWIRSSTEALSSRTCLVLEPKSVAHRPAPTRPFRSDSAVKLAMDLKTDFRSVLALEGRPGSAVIERARRGDLTPTIQAKDLGAGCIVPAPRRGGSIRNENYGAHAAKTSCDTSHARRNGSPVEWMLQLGSSKRAQRRRLSWMGMLQCFERGYEVTPRRNAKQPSFVMRNRTHLADQGKGYQAARVESEPTSHPGGRSLALQSPMTGAVESRGTSFRDEMPQNRFDIRVGGGF